MSLYFYYLYMKLKPNKNLDDLIKELDLLKLESEKYLKSSVFSYNLYMSVARRAIQLVENYIVPPIDKFTDKLNTLQHDFSIESTYLEPNPVGQEIMRLINGFSISDEIQGLITPDLSTYQGKIDYILSKLYQIKYGISFRIYDIFFFNELEFNNSLESNFADVLEQKGFIDRALYFDSKTSKARLTVKGGLYVENMLKPKANRKKVNSAPELNEILNDLIKKLDTLGLGQEVIYNEIEELRKLIGVVNEKNWTELLKGKIFDLALGQVV